MIRIDADRLNEISEAVVGHMNIIQSLNQERADMWSKLETDFNENLKVLQEQYPVLDYVVLIQTVMVGNSGSLSVKFGGSADVTAASLSELEELTGLCLSHLTRRDDEVLAIFRLH